MNEWESKQKRKELREEEREGSGYGTRKREFLLEKFNKKNHERKVINPQDLINKKKQRWCENATMKRKEGNHEGETNGGADCAIKIKE